MMSFSRPIQWYHSHANLIWQDGTFKTKSQKVNFTEYGFKQIISPLNPFHHIVDIAYEKFLTILAKRFAKT